MSRIYPDGFRPRIEPPPPPRTPDQPATNVNDGNPQTPTNPTPSTNLAERQGIDTAAQRQADLQKRELLLDAGQMALDVVGIFDPTPISDGANGIVSLFRGDLLGAGISAVSMVPYIGDAAKFAKLPKYVQTVGRIADLARVDPRFADAVRPALEKIRGALDGVSFDGLPEAARRPLQELKGKVDEFFNAKPATAPPPPRSSDTFTTTLRGEPIDLPNVTTRQVSYTKRPDAERNQLRNAFNAERAAFVKDLATDPAKVAKLREAGLTDAQIAKLRDGGVPDGWQVHHKLPLDDGGTNAHSNLVLIKNDPYHLAFNNVQRQATRGMGAGETRVIDWPTPNGFVYPPS